MEGVWGLLASEEIEAAARNYDYRDISEDIRTRATDAGSRLKDSLFDLAERLEDLVVGLPYDRRAIKPDDI